MSGGSGGAIGQSAPASNGNLSGGLTLKKKIYPKSSPKKLTEKIGWKKSFKYGQSSSKKKI